MTFLFARIISVIMLFIALGNNSREYYNILRFVICGVAAYSAYYSLNVNKERWAGTMGIIAIVFNPVIKIYLNRELWGFIDIIVAVIFIVSFFALKTPKQDVKQ